MEAGKPPSLRPVRDGTNGLPCSPPPLTPSQESLFKNPLPSHPMRTLTQAQQAKADARKAKRKAMMENLRNAGKINETENGYISITGKSYSPRNQMFLAMQNVPAGQLAGFRQWLTVGRAVKKGETGADIMIPITNTKDDADEAEEDNTYFTWTSLFHYTQTEELKAKA